MFLRCLLYPVSRVSSPLRDSQGMLSPRELWCIKPWPNGPPNSRVSFGHPFGSSWIELAWIWSNSSFRPTRAKFSAVWPPQRNSSQLSPSCFVIVMWLRARIQTIKLFLASWLDLAVPFGHPPMQVLICNLARVGLSWEDRLARA